MGSPIPIPSHPPIFDGIRGEWDGGGFGSEALVALGKASSDEGGGGSVLRVCSAA